MKIHLATGSDFDTVQEIVSSTISTVYSAFYPEDVVSFFLDHHGDDVIIRDLTDQNVYLLDIDGVSVGTGSIRGNEITRVFVKPEYQRKGYGTLIMQDLESIVARSSSIVRIDSSLPGYGLYLKLGYRPIAYRMISTPNGQVLCYHEMEKTLSSSDASPEAYPFPNYDNHVFRMVSTGEQNDFSSDTVFILHQEGKTLWGDFSGGSIIKGFLVGTVNEAGELDYCWNYVNNAYEKKMGEAKAVPENLSDERIRLVETRTFNIEGKAHSIRSIYEELK